MSSRDLRREYERLTRQIADLLAEPHAAGSQWQQLLEQIRSLTAQYAEKLAAAEAQIADLKRELFGPKADRLTAEQEDQLHDVLQDMEANNQRSAPDGDDILEEDQPTPKTPRRCRRMRYPLPLDMETETVTIEPELGPCPCCGKMPVRIGEEVSEEMDRIPARLIRRRTVRPKYACPCGDAGVAIAPLPPRLIPQSRLGLGLAIYIVLARFDDHLSFYRLEQQFRERHAVEIPRQQMVQWIEHIATWLEPVVDRMWQSMRAGGYLQVDETPVKVLDPEVRGKAAQGYLWFYAVPGGDVLLDFDSSRGLDPLRRKLSGFGGTIQTDAYEVYESLHRKSNDIVRIGCLAHARRYMYKALQESFTEAAWFIAQIRALYRIEDEIRGFAPADRYTQRLQRAPDIWKAMKARAQRLSSTLLPKSTLGKAIHYFLNDYEALLGYLNDGRFEIDNNLVENAIRPTAVGRKRWLFIGHPDAGWRSAVIYSILLSCRRRSINPEDYLSDILRRLPTIKMNQIDSLVPANWKLTHGPG